MPSVIGHQEVLDAFDRMVARGTLAHAFLLVGSVSVGKATVARWVAGRLLCVASSQLPAPSRKQPDTIPKRRVAPCGTCNHCQQVERGVHPDVFILRPVDGSITIDAVREWTTALRRTSLFAGWKVGIIEGAEELTEAAANACLKAIEEPTPRTLILLTVPNRRQVMATIASRCALVTCRRVPLADLETALRERGASPAEARAIADAADGRPGIAMTLLQNPEYRQEAEAFQQAARATISGSSTDRLRRVDVLLRDRASDRSAASKSALKLVEVFRALGRQQLQSASSVTPAFSRWMELLSRAPDHLAANVSPRLLLESIVLTAP